MPDKEPNRAHDKEKREIEAIFAPIFTDILARVEVADRFVDKPNYQILLTTLWANVVLDPEDAGLTENDLETLYGVVNDEIERVLGAGFDITECFRFVNTKLGERAMSEARLTQTHKEMLLYFSSMILDPRGHEKWMDEVRHGHD